MVLGAVAAVMFVNVTAPQMTVGTEPMPAENARTMDRGGGLVRNEVTDRIEDRTREKFRADLSGRARVIDGDTLEVGGARVRLYGIDAPESAQRCRSGGRTWSCGREATRALARRIGSRPVSCKEHDRDRYGRMVAVCWVGHEDVNAWMAARGWAFAYRKYSMSYVVEEAAAKMAKRGIWQGDVVAPWEWRRGERLAGGRSAAQPAASRPAAQKERGRCAIKGNISKSGTRIYHVPGGRFYGQTRINTSKGERWFCTEAEARAAGWRRSRPAASRAAAQKERGRCAITSTTRTGALSPVSALHDKLLF